MSLSAMPIERIFLFTVAVLEAGAVGGYLWGGNTRLALIWACYALATLALAGVK